VKNAPADVLPLLVRADERLAVADRAGAIKALEQATASAPSLIDAQLWLAAIYLANGQRPEAIDRYRAVLKVDANHVGALNDLAYNLAASKDGVAEALPLAKRAAALAPKSGAVVDTLGWIEYLSGDHAAASAALAMAVKLAPGNAEIRLHAAVVHEALGDRAAAETELKEALTLNPALESSEEVKALRKRLAQR
jgi:tetratricopeptide (TPR) repeat protein